MVTCPTPRVSEALSSSAKHLGQLCEHLAATSTRYPGIDPVERDEVGAATDQALTMTPGPGVGKCVLASRQLTPAQGLDDTVEY